MSEDNICMRVQESIAAYRGGWLTKSELKKMEDHLAACPTCAQEVRRDERICRALAEEPEIPPPALTWRQAFAAKGPMSRAGHRTTRPAYGLLAAAVVFMAMFLWWPRGSDLHTIPNPSHVAEEPISKSALNDATTYSDAHHAFDAVDMTGDPNRAVILCASQQTPGALK